MDKNKVIRARHYARKNGVQFLPLDFPTARPLTVHLKDMLDKEVDPSFYVQDEQLEGFISFDNAEDVTRGIVCVGTLPNIKGFDILKRVYGVGGASPCLPTCGGGSIVPKVLISSGNAHD